MVKGNGLESSKIFWGNGRFLYPNSFQLWDPLVLPNAVASGPDRAAEAGYRLYENSPSGP